MTLTTGTNRYEYGDIITMAAGTATAAEVIVLAGGRAMTHAVVSVRTEAAWAGTATVTPYLDEDDTVGGEPSLVTIANATNNVADVTTEGAHRVGISVAANNKATTVRVTTWRAQDGS
jgi:hypothetical protein